MSDDDLREKLGKFFSRFGQGKDQKIKAEDVLRIVDRLQQRVAELSAELQSEAAPKKRLRLQAKLETAERMQQRAMWLLSELRSDASEDAETGPTPVQTARDPERD